jgi:hypothetical protein
MLLLIAMKLQHPPLVDRPQKKRGKIPKPTAEFLKDWLHRHSEHPYPSEDEKKQICAATGLSMSQVSNWMINVGLTSVISTSLTRLTLIRLADGCLYVHGRLTQPQPILFRSGAVVQLALRVLQAHYSAEHPRPLIVCNCIAHLGHRPSHALSWVSLAPTRTTRRPLTNEMSRKINILATRSQHRRLGLHIFNLGMRWETNIPHPTYRLKGHYRVVAVMSTMSNDNISTFPVAIDTDATQHLGRTLGISHSDSAVPLRILSTLLPFLPATLSWITDILCRE